jgi:tripartite-type tricarboxylate transporter receptor subunit TctC
LQLVAGAAAIPIISRIAIADAYSTRPVRIIVGFAAGGGADIIARVMAQQFVRSTGSE